MAACHVGTVALSTLLAVRVRDAGRTKTAVKNCKQNKSKQKWEEIKRERGESEGKFIFKGKVHKDGKKTQQTVRQGRQYF